MSDNKKKIMLVTPPYHSGVVECAGVWLNAAFVYIAGALRAKGHEARIYDAMSYFVDHDRIAAEIEDYKPDFVAVTAITASLPDSIELLKRAKELNPRIVTVIGNVHPTFMWREILTEHADAVDYVVRCEGEITLPELVEAVSSGGDVSKVDGIAFARDGAPFATDERPQIANLDALPRAWDLIDWPIYTYRPVKDSILAVISSSRGCGQMCSFCSQQLYWKRNWRARSAESFVDELELLRTKYGVNVAMISDETPTLDRKRWEKILDLLVERDLDLEILMETRVDDILRDEEILGKYYAAGISHIYVGVESADQATLDSFKKNISVEQSKRALDLINSHDMITETSFVLGTPDETPERVRKTIDLAKHYDPDMAFFLAITPWPYADIYPSLEPFIEVWDYAHYNLVEPVIKPRNMTRQQVLDAMDRASQEFFMNKFMNLNKLSEYKRSFMVKVMSILMNHSYLADKMKAIGSEMPEWVRDMLKTFNAEDKKALGMDAPHKHGARSHNEID